MHDENWCREESCPHVELHKAHKLKARWSYGRRKMCQEAPAANLPCPSCNGQRCWYCKLQGTVSYRFWRLWRDTTRLEDLGLEDLKPVM